MGSEVRSNIPEFLRALREANTARVKASRDAVRVEGFRLMRLLQGELRRGAPGGRSLAPLREISQLMERTPPLSPLAKAIRYHVAETEPFHVEIGGVDSRAQRRAMPGFSGIQEERQWAAKGLSGSWVHILQVQQEGATMPVTDDMRQFLKGVGAKMAGRKGRPGQAAKYFFLKKSTTEFTLPARDIIDTFWGAHESEVMPNIRSNFDRKMRGERI
jgi:hypothetical protein